MSLTFEVANTFIIVPDLESAVLTTRDEVLALASHINRVEFALRSFNRSDYLSIVFLPISDLSV